MIQRTHSGAPHDPQSPVNIHEQLEFLTLEEPENRSRGRLGQRVLLNLSKVRNRVQNGLQFVVGFMVVKMVVKVVTSDIDARVLKLNVLGTLNRLKEVGQLYAEDVLDRSLPCTDELCAIDKGPACSSAYFAGPSGSDEHLSLHTDPPSLTR